MRVWASKFSNNSAFVSTLLLTAGAAFAQYSRQLATPPSVSKPEDLCSIQGHITNALTGEAVKKASVVFQLLRPNAPQAVQGYTSISDNDGNYRFDNIEPGDYWLSASHEGYQTARYGPVGNAFGVPKLTLRPSQQLTNIDLKLLPFAVVSGRIVDQDGDPVLRATVEAVVPSWRGEKIRYIINSFSRTNDLGNYRLVNVRPGKCYLLAYKIPDPRIDQTDGNPDIRSVKTYFPDASTVDAATALSIKAGQSLTDVNVRLLSGPTFHIRGNIVGQLPPGVNGRLSVRANVLGDESAILHMAGGLIRQDRTFDIPGFIPGSYRLIIQTSDARPEPLGHTDVNVAQSDVTNVQIAITPPVTLHGQIVMEGSLPARTPPADLKGIRVSLTASDPDSEMIYGTFESASVNDDGTFTIENVPPGTYNVYANNRPRDTFLKSLSVANQDVSGHVANIPPGASELTLTFSYGGAEVDGSVQFPQTTSTAPQSTPQAVVYLLPNPMDENGYETRIAAVQRNGMFWMRSVPPGRYRAFAAEDMSREDIQNAEILAQLSGQIVEITVSPGEKKQIQLPLITDDELQQVYLRLGIDSQH